MVSTEAPPEVWWRTQLGPSAWIRQVEPCEPEADEPEPDEPKPDEPKPEAPDEKHSAEQDKTIEELKDEAPCDDGTVLAEA